MATFERVATFEREDEESRVLEEEERAVGARERKSRECQTKVKVRRMRALAPSRTAALDALEEDEDEDDEEHSPLVVAAQEEAVDAEAQVSLTALQVKAAQALLPQRHFAAPQLDDDCSTVVLSEHLEPRDDESVVAVVHSAGRRMPPQPQQMPPQPQRKPSRLEDGEVLFKYRLD